MGGIIHADRRLSKALLGHQSKKGIPLINGGWWNDLPTLLVAAATLEQAGPLPKALVLRALFFEHPPAAFL